MTQTAGGARPRVLVLAGGVETARRVLTLARDHAAETGGRLAVLAVRAGGDDPAPELLTPYADEVLVPRPERGGVLDAFIVALASVRAWRPDAVLAAGVEPDSELATRLAQRLGAASATDCIAIGAAPDGGTRVRRFVHGGRFLATVVLRSQPTVVTLRVDGVTPVPATARGLVVPFPLPSGSVADGGARRAVRVVGHRRLAAEPADITRVPVVVAAGRGVRRREDLDLLRALAAALGGELAGSRPLVDQGWLAADRLVGISGRRVAPRLYLACGISGQAEHVTGLRPAGTVVAVNPDASAPIHQAADYSVLDDLYRVVPALIEGARSRRTARSG